MSTGLRAIHHMLWLSSHLTEKQREATPLVGWSGVTSQLSRVHFHRDMFIFRFFVYCFLPIIIITITFIHHRTWCACGCGKITGA